MQKSEEKQKIFKIITQYLTKLGEKGATMSLLSRRVNRFWPECPLKITRELIQDIDKSNQLYIDPSGSFGKIYLQGRQPVSVCSDSSMITDVAKTTPDKLPPAEPVRFPMSHEKLAQEFSQVDFSAARKIAPDNHSPSTMSARIAAVCDHIKKILQEKNRSYGNSVGEPVRIFSQADPIEQINVRIDDKLSRLISGSEYPGDDTELDLIGYLILKRVLVCDPTAKKIKSC